MLDVTKIITILGSGALNAWGGYSWHNARRYLMPVLLGGEAGFIVWENKRKDWWAGLLVLPVIGTLCLGYFNGKNWGRALWLFLQAIIIGLGLTLTGHIQWFIYIPYIIGAGILGGIYRNWWQPLGDFISGCWLGLIILFVR